MMIEFVNFLMAALIVSPFAILLILGFAGHIH